MKNSNSDTREKSKTVIVVGSGGREHAIVKSLFLSKHVGKIYVAPGNGGTVLDGAINVTIDATNIDEIVRFSLELKPDMVVVAPDDPLVLGMVDALENVGIRAFGPSKKASQAEGSKVFSKNLMKKYDIPTAKFEIFDDFKKASEYIEANKVPIVIKADGLAKGKGVYVSETKEEAIQALREIMLDKIFGQSGGKVVIEECLFGREISVLTFTDGKTIRPMVSAQDHKRAFDGDKGPNTGGMGTFAPSPIYTPKIAEYCEKNIFKPTIDALKKEGCNFKGVLYFGLMLTSDGIKVIEYNARFGDPEAQVVLPLLKGDLYEIMEAIIEERLETVDFCFSDEAAVCVIVASGGYPKNHKNGYEIEIGDVKSTIYHAGTTIIDNKLKTAGGRVLGVTAVAENLETAAKKAYQDVSKVKFTDSFYRKDIAKISDIT